MLKFLCVFLTITYSPLCRGRRTSTSVDIVFTADNNQDYDFLSFSQQWPVTRCIFLAEKTKQNICAASSWFDEQRWTIHGIWPTRIGTISPAFCSKVKKFDVQQLEPFFDELSEHWVDIGNDTSSTVLWKHEWVKHGTCCAETALETEATYFSQGLQWLEKFNMTQILNAGGIVPGGVYKITHVHNMIHKEVKKVPSIHCDCSKNGVSYLSEIRLCFSKSLELIDCHVTGNSEVVYGSAASKSEIVTNCNLHADIIYPDNVPAVDCDINTISSWVHIKLQKVYDFLKQTLVN
ncbi:ribonuclease Oy isoform X1 [Bradysia coprophila]|uniref:ribonuclease Oy isoform X1 n=1 Tax=Bradysia coprophila TaxID=38358 RepID=UPI00187D9407|nr:ribonuclease Oy isoform X1 [Bradysia coprophila]